MSYIIVTFCPGAVKKARGFFTKCLMFSLFAETRRRRFFLPRQALRGTMEETYSYPFVEETAMFIDLRSDTITQPTESMRRAMAAGCTLEAGPEEALELMLRAMDEKWPED